MRVDSGVLDLDAVGEPTTKAAGQLPKDIVAEIDRNQTCGNAAG